MVDEQVIQLATEFKGQWSELFRNQVKYIPDLTWPSVGILDLITYQLQHTRPYSEVDNLLLLQSAAYLAGLAHDCWSTFPDQPEVRVTLEQPSNEIVISANGGKQLKPKESFSLSVSGALTKIFRNLPEPFPVLSNFSRVLEAEGNRVSPFALGLLTGLCPYGVGPWSSRKPEEMPGYTQAATFYLAESSAEYYKRVFPGEEIGQDPRLYLAGLVLPPALYDEPFVGCRAASGLAGYLKMIDATAEQQTTVAQNLALSPDELIASAGFAVSVALCAGPATDRLRLTAEAFPSYRSQLRPAIVLTRRLLNLPADFCELFDAKGADKEEKYAQAEQLVEIERTLGLIPLLRISTSKLRDPKLKDLLMPIAWTVPDVARVTLDEIISAGESSAELVLQGVHLDITLGDLERAKEELSQLETNGSVGSAADWANLHELKGILLLAGGELEPATEALHKAFYDFQPSPERRTSVGNNLTYALISAGRFQDALAVTDSVIQQEPSSVPAIANRIGLLRQLGDFDSARDELAQLARRAPVNRQIFSNLIIEGAD